jgi:hypothetical protein
MWPCGTPDESGVRGEGDAYRPSSQPPRHRKVASGHAACRNLICCCGSEPIETSVVRYLGPAGSRKSYADVVIVDLAEEDKAP